jgi:hypothetical protein
VSKEIISVNVRDALELGLITEKQVAGHGLFEFDQLSFLATGVVTSHGREVCKLDKKAQDKVRAHVGGQAPAGDEVRAHVGGQAPAGDED